MRPPDMTPDARNPKRTVFIVDDHPLVREWLINLINQQPDLAVCGESEGPPQAFEAIGASKPDVAIVDISLKNSSGIELIKDLKASHPAVAVLVLSMHEESHYAERALRAGARGYVMKRETTHKVVEAIRRILEGKLYVSESLAGVLAAHFIDDKKGANRSPAEKLSDRELEVFDMLGRGMGTRQISERMGISLKTVQAYCARMKDKLSLGSGNELLREAIRWNDSNQPR
jgi:DNA-binding NarL/FixJ family response regulator